MKEQTEKPATARRGRPSRKPVEAPIQLAGFTPGVLLNEAEGLHKQGKVRLAARKAREAIRHIEMLSGVARARLALYRSLDKRERPSYVDKEKS